MRFFKAVEGHVVHRFGTSSATSSNERFGHSIGAGGVITWDTEAVLAISDAEAARYQREYDRLVRQGALIEVDEAAWNAWRAERKARAKKSAAEQTAQPPKEEAAPAEPAGA